MGVTYKLKEEVTAFIIGQKKLNPSISVRELASLTGEQFLVKVSKSSVNLVLKSVSLSSSVGRRSQEGLKPGKFAIPLKRKKEISGNMEKFGLSKEPPETVPQSIREKKKELNQQPDIPVPQESSVTSAVDQPPETSRTAQPKAVETSQPAGLPAKLSGETIVGKKEPPASFHGLVAHRRGELERNKITGVCGLGYVFLKAAEWEISGQPLVPRWLEKFDTRPHSTAFDVAWEMYAYLQFMGARKFDDLSGFDKHGLWYLTVPFDTAPDGNRILSSIEEVFRRHASLSGTESTSLEASYSEDKKHFFSTVKCFKLILEDGNELVLDAIMSCCQLNGMMPVSQENTLPVDKAMSCLSRNIISNRECLIFRDVPGAARFDRSFYEMAAVFENVPGKKIVQAAVLNEANEKIAGFSTIPSQKRNFMAGVRPQQKEFAQMTKNIKWAGKQPFYHEETDRIFYWVETRTDFLSQEFLDWAEEYRVITVWNEKGENPAIAILTNQMSGSGEAIVSSYLMRWPYLYQPQQFINNSISEKETDQGVKKEEFNIFSDFIRELCRYCRQHYFTSRLSELDDSYLIRTIYDISGELTLGSSSIKIGLNIPEGHPYAEDLNYAAFRINERGISDRLRRRLWVKT